MLALMYHKPRTDATQVVNTPVDPAQALLRRFTGWEKRIENLIAFFTHVQKFQKVHSKHYTELSDLVMHKFGEDERLSEDGIVSIWRGLKDKTTELARFYDGLHDTYGETIVNDLKMRLADIRIFKNEITRLRSKQAEYVAGKQKRFLNAVGDLNDSINRIRTPTAREDPFVQNRGALF